ncbi:AAA family ATPase [Microbulbifer sp. YPW16]|uniref:AAA family ATPase n=1 Tax=Microbulbifer sp. YPW16 TaxID=2904242 RepID=UPI001E5877E2|nr:DUF3696 domain-containing protein [Microbulbifer sp. YPW16]UHQ55326.1 DUF3696 domain-containing protein [Microbulbifer sp. YPW16]
MARVTSLGLSNFKAIGEKQQKIVLSPITLLFGPNSAGKSTVLQALIYLREMIGKRNLNPDRTELGGSWLDLGGFQNLVHGRNLDTAMEFEVELALDSDELPEYLSEYEQEMLDNEGLPAVADFFTELEIATVRLKLRWSQSLARPVIESYQCFLNGEEIALLKASPDGRQVNIERMPLSFQGFQAPMEEHVSETSLAQLLSDMLNSSVVNAGAIESVSSRPYKTASMEEVEALVNTEALPAKPLLVQIKEELACRTTRRAHALEHTVDRLLLLHDENPVIEMLGLHGQPDAMPNFANGLELSSEVWCDSDERDDGIEKAQRKLAAAVVNAAICGPLQCLASWLDELSYIGPLRDLPPRSIQSRSTPDKSRWAKGLAAWELLPTAKSLVIDEINFWLGESCLDSGYQLLVKKYRELENTHPIYQMLEAGLDEDDQEILKDLLSELPQKVRVCLKEEKTDLEVMPQDIGVGISQLFPVVALSVTQKCGLAAIEQPELHIHPRLQVEMADVFASCAKQSNVMFLLETHSEHLMLRLLRRVRESASNFSRNTVALKPQDLAVHYVEPNEAGTEFKQLRVSDEGDFLDEWPQGFFDERDEELF